ncbi:glycine receptor subunit alpha-2-like protein, partial [Dinothrombium tinctorium]
MLYHIKNINFSINLTILILFSLFIQHSCDYFDEDEDLQDLDVKNTDRPPNGYAEVEVTFYLRDVNSVNALDMDFIIDYYIEHKWTVADKYCDHYFSEIQKSGVKIKRGCNGDSCSAKIQSENIERFWVPDTYLMTAKKVEMPTKFTDSKILLIKFNGLNTCTLIYVLKLHALVSCQMNFHHYPFDIQTCAGVFRSYSHNESDLTYIWSDTGVEANLNFIKLTNFNLNISKKLDKVDSLNETFGTFVVNFIFKREIYGIIIHIYAPSALIVVLSWFSFWMSLDAIPGRVTLCVVALLALVTQFSAIRLKLPPISYITGADVWMLICMILVFGTLIEFAVIKHISKQNEINKLLLTANTKRANDEIWRSNIELAVSEHSSQERLVSNIKLRKRKRLRPKEFGNITTWTEEVQQTAVVENENEPKSCETSSVNAKKEK